MMEDTLLLVPEPIMRLSLLALELIWIFVGYKLILVLISLKKKIDNGGDDDGPEEWKKSLWLRDDD